MIIAYHLIWTAYGWWLPNDPRGGGSHFVCKDVLADLGELHFGGKRVQPTRKLVREFYEQAAERLLYPLLTFDEKQRKEIGVAFEQVIEAEHLTLRLRDHAGSRSPADPQASAEVRRDDGAIAEQEPGTAGRVWASLQGASVWTGGHGWVVYLDTPDEVRRTVRYIEQNPIKNGLPAQTWSFVKTYDVWPLHRI